MRHGVHYPTSYIRNAIVLKKSIGAFSFPLQSYGLDEESITSPKHLLKSFDSAEVKKDATEKKKLSRQMAVDSEAALDKEKKEELWDKEIPEVRIM